MSRRTIGTTFALTIIASFMLAMSLSLSACANNAATTSSSNTASSESQADSTSNTDTENAESSDAGDADQEKLAADYNLTGTLTEPIGGPYATGTHHATIEVEGFGTIKVELNANAAPITVSNFAQLVEGGFYDGLTFHRIINGFMIQGGDPAGNGTGGSARTIKGEFFANGIKNVIKHQRGVISMARSSDYDSASSQFFIMHETTDSLDQQYAAFGKVTEGMEVVDAIATSVAVEDDNGTVARENQPVITSIKMDD